MEIFKKIQYGSVEINDVWRKVPLRINEDSLNRYQLKNNDRLDLISEESFDTNIYWWLLQILNPEMDPFKLNVDNNKILNSIQKSLRLNPISILRDIVLNLIKKLKYYINIYLEEFISTPDDIFLYNQQLLSFNQIEKYIRLYPRKEDLNISLYDYYSNDELISHKRKINDWCINSGFYSLYNGVNINLNNRYVFNILDSTNIDVKFIFQYNEMFYQVSILDTHTTNDIILNIYNRIGDINIKMIDNMIFTEQEIQYKNIPLRVYHQNIGDKLNILKIILKVLSNWSKNGI